MDNDSKELIDREHQMKRVIENIEIIRRG